MYKIILKVNRTGMREAKDWCENAGIAYATSYKDNIYDGYWPGSADNMELACYFAFEHELDAATFCMMFGGRINYVSGQRHFV